MADVFNIILLLALPASGKSEVRNFMANIEENRLQKDFHVGKNLQLDDFPYVHLMRRIDQELVKLNHRVYFYPDDNSPFLDDRDWGTLIELLNEDYFDLISKKEFNVESASLYLFDRIEKAASKCGIPARLATLEKDIKEKIAKILEKECRDIINDKIKEYPDNFDNKTIIIEAARGGKDKASMPLEDPFGYQYSLRKFCPEILSNATILYIWVTPEESRRKNADRADPNDPGSILHHGVPLTVMMHDYGCDDMEYLMKTSEVKNTITVKAHNKTYHLPIGVFDNRVDKTSFLREEKSKWDVTLVEEVTQAIKLATDTMWENYKK